MPERLFVATLGFNETYIVNTLHRYGASRGDGLLVVTLSPIVGGVRKALNNLNGIASVMGFTIHGVIDIDRGDAASSITSIIERLQGTVEKNGYKQVIADLTGGPRIVVVSTLIALIASSNRLRIEVRVQDETGGEGDLRFNMDLLKAVLTGLGEKGRILAYVASNPGVSPGEIAEALGLASKTVSNYLTYLKKLGLVAQKGRGRGVYPTEWGLLLAGLREA